MAMNASQNAVFNVILRGDCFKMTDDFSKKLGELLSDVLETGEINLHTKEFSSSLKDNEEANAPKIKQHDGHKVKFSAGELHKNFFKKKRAGEVIKEGTYKDFTKIPQNILDAFEILGCTPDSTLPDARAAFRKKIKETHPDTKAARVAYSTSSTASDAENLQDEISENIIGAYERLKVWFSQI